MRFPILRPQAKSLRLRRSLQSILNKASVYLARTALCVTEWMLAGETVLIFTVFQPA
jgi:hypothetical protein